MRHKWTIEDAPPKLFLQRQHGLVWDLEALKREMEQPASERRAASLRHALKNASCAVSYNCRFSGPRLMIRL